MSGAYEIDILDSATGLPVAGSFGPIRTAQTWDDSDDLDGSGAVSCEIPRADLKTDLISTDSVLRCSTLRGTTWTPIGYAIVDQLTEDNQADAPPLLEAGGQNPLIDLATRTVGNLVLTDNAHSHNENPMPAADILAAIVAFFPAGWTVIGTPSEDTYLAYSGESCLAALVKLAGQIGDHFRYEYDSITGNIVRWLPKSTPAAASGIRAMGNIPNPRSMDSTTCLITHLTRKRDSSKRVTRVWAYGGGNQKARITLQGATYTLPAGYAYDSETISGVTRYCIKHTALDAVRRIDAEQSFDDIAQVDTTTGHALSAKNALAQAAAVWLPRHVDVYYSYDVEVAGLTQAVLAGQTVRTVYDQFLAGRRIPVVDADLLVLNVKKRLDADNTPRVVSLTLASSDRWPEDDTTLAAGSVMRQSSNSAHLQVASRALAADTADAATTIPGALASGYVKVTTGTGALSSQAPPIPAADGGTGAGALTAGSVVFAGVAGVYSQDNTNLFWDDTNNWLGVGTNAPATPIDINILDAGTTTQTVGLITRHRSSGTPGVGFGSTVRFQAETDNHTNANQFGITTTWQTATNASQKGRVQFFIYDTAAREFIRADATGTTVNMGLLGASDYGSGAKVIAIPNATTAPTTNPSGGGVLYVSGGALHYKGSSGTDTVLGPA